MEANVALTDSESHAEGHVADGVDAAVDGRVPDVNQETQLWNFEYSPDHWSAFLAKRGDLRLNDISANFTTSKITNVSSV